MTRALGIAAGSLGMIAAFAGSPYIAHHGRIDVDALARAVAHEDDHVTAIELAGWIKHRRPGLRVIDVRSQSEYDAFHVPTAERMAIDSLSSAIFRRSDTIVLYSEGGAHAAQAWVFLRALGYDNVYFLRGGLYEWLDQVMSPALQAGAPPNDSAAFDSVAALSRYFGGVPRVGVSSLADEAITLPLKGADSAAVFGPRRSAPQSTSALAVKIRRRGC